VPSPWLLVFLLKGAPAVVDTAGALAPSLVLTGDDAAVLAVRGALAERKVPLSSSLSAPVLSARIEPTDDGLALTIRDPAGRMASHQVVSAALAAALIESWMRPDLTGPLLAPHPMPPADVPTVVASPPAPVPPRTGGPAVAFMGETSLASEGSLWMGASAAGRVGWGPTRLGTRARFSTQTVASASKPAVYKEDKDADLARLAAELILEAEHPFALGPVWLSPGLGVGGTWTRNRASHEEKMTVVHAIGPVVEGRLILTIPLGQHLGLEVGLGLAIAPALGTGASRQDDFTVPAAPLGQLRGGIGLRYGRP
jgi:hypothetical protein